MAKSPKTISQHYPRIHDENSKFNGYLDDSALVPHTRKIPVEELKTLIRAAIDNASRKSSEEILAIPPDATPETIEKIYVREGKKLFRYFKKYPGDPASTARKTYGKHYGDVALQQFFNRSLQKERMNSGWRYQYLAEDCAQQSGRFRSVSGINSAETDFCAVINLRDNESQPLSLYVSVKNRVNTMGGQDWPKAIQALENVAKNDKNKLGAYCCVFGIAMDKGDRLIKYNQKTKSAHSINTEVWFSDFFWPFFANYTYEEIMLHVLDVLMESQEAANLTVQIVVPELLIESFGNSCRDAGLIDDEGYFHDPHQLVRFFVS